MSDKKLELLKAIEEEKKKHLIAMEKIEKDGEDKKISQKLEYELRNKNLEKNNTIIQNWLNEELNSLIEENKRLKELIEIKRKKIEEDNQLNDEYEEDEEEGEENEKDNNDIIDYSSCLN
jgi:hypothetical protein